MMKPKSIDFDAEIQHIQDMTAKQLVQYAADVYHQKLKIDNGRSWLVKKVSYLALSRHTGGKLEGRAAVRATALDDPKTVAALKDVDNKVKCVGNKVKSSIEPRRSAAQLFCSLIMDNAYTDDEIFKRVKEVYNLSDDKRSYVAWYRNSLKRAGKNPPIKRVK